MTWSKLHFVMGNSEQGKMIVLIDMIEITIAWELICVWNLQIINVHIYTFEGMLAKHDFVLRST